MTIRHAAASPHRGARDNPTGRYERLRAEGFDDGWDQGGDWGWDDLPPLRTTVTDEKARTILTRNGSPDLPFDVSINLYRGCEHGCIYCYARPTHARFGYSPGLDFETKLFAKPDAPALLETALRKPSYSVSPIALGTNTDPYQPIEQGRGLMRGILQVLAEYRHPVSIVTKSALIRRDLDLLGDLAADDLVHVGVSLTTLDRDLSRAMEPRATPPKGRLAAIRALADAGVPVTVMVAPVVPGLTDHELDGILEAAKDAGAQSAMYILLRLPDEVEELFVAWLNEHRPDGAKRILSLLRQCRGGAVDQRLFQKRFTGSGTMARLLSQRFHKAVKRLDLVPAERPTLRCDLFRRPPRPGDQLSLL